MNCLIVYHSDYEDSVPFEQPHPCATGLTTPMRCDVIPTDSGSGTLQLAGH